MPARWNTFTDLRIGGNNSPLVSGDPTLKEYFEIAPRNVSRARICLTIGEYRGQMGSESAPQYAAGDTVNDPFDDEVLPLVPEELLSPQQSCPVLGQK